MALNASIFGNMLNAPKSPEEYLAERQNLQASKLANALNQQKADEYTKGIARQGELRNLLAGGADASGLRKGGFLDEAQKLQEQQTAAAEEARKAKTFDVDHAKRIMTLQGGLAKQVMANPSGQSAMAAIAEMERMSGQNMDAERQKIAMLQTPDQIRQWAAGHALTAEQLLPKLDTLNLGGSVQTRMVDPITGKATVTSTDKATMTPGQSAQLAQSERHFQTSRADSMSKPFEVTGPDGLPMLVQQDKQGNIRPVQGYGPKAALDKPLNDSQSKALLFGSRMQAANKVLADLEKTGTSASVPGSRTPIIGGIISAAQGANQQSLDQAKRDFMTAILRRESGASISPTEFDTADKQYFPQIGDSKQVRAQKAANRQLAIDGVLVEVPEKQRGSLSKPPQQSGPKAGAIEDGHRFKGGDPSNPSNWEKVK